MDELEIAFKEYVETFKNLEISDKRKEVIRAVNEITAMFDMLATEIGVQVKYLKSNEINELEIGYESEDTYLNALIVYIENAKSILGQYLIEINRED